LHRKELRSFRRARAAAAVAPGAPAGYRSAAAARCAPAPTGPGLKRAKAATNPRRIDVHHHYLPLVHADAMATHRQGNRPPKWSAAQSLD